MNDILIHDGVKGQKWGVRHGPPYPLKDDQVPEKMKKANPKIYSDNKEDNRKRKPQVIVKPRGKISRREMRKISDKELDAYVKRTAKEKDYYQMQKDIAYTANPFKTALKEALREAGKKALINVGTDVATYLGQKAITSLLGKWKDSKSKGYIAEDWGTAIFGKNFKNVDRAKNDRINRNNRKNNKNNNNNNNNGSGNASGYRVKKWNKK